MLVQLLFGFEVGLAPKVTASNQYFAMQMWADSDG
jgi:hypothetical protein